MKIKNIEYRFVIYKTYTIFFNPRWYFVVERKIEGFNFEFYYKSKKFKIYNDILNKIEYYEKTIIKIFST